MGKPLFSYAIDHALLAIGRHSPARAPGGYGRDLKEFVALKTAKRVGELGYVKAQPYIGAKGSRLELTAYGHEAFSLLVTRENTGDESR